jgi:hypothetical protein
VVSHGGYVAFQMATVAISKKSLRRHRGPDRAADRGEDVRRGGAPLKNLADLRDVGIQNKIFLVAYPGDARAYDG